MPNSWKPEVQTDATGAWYDNALRFATKQEAENNARDLAMRWFAVLEWRAAPSSDPVNYTYAKGELVPLAPPRALHEIAREIFREWHNPYFGAVPYLCAMGSLSSISDKYGADDARSVVLYFLSNATTWRGETARRIKAELKALAKSR